MQLVRLYINLSQLNQLEKTKLVNIQYEFKENHFVRTDKVFPYFQTKNETLNYISYDFHNLESKQLNSISLVINLPMEFNQKYLKILPNDAVIVFKKILTS